MFKAIAPDHADPLPDDRATITVLSHDQVLPADEGAPCVRPLRGAPTFADRMRARIQAFEHWCERIDLAPDLADDIGSRRWYRGMATLIGLAGIALAFWPDFSSVEAATTMPVDVASRDEFLSQTIAPLALGADTGRHMGATSLVRALPGVPERPRVQLVATLAEGDSFARMLERVGVGPLDASRAADLVGQSVPLDQIAPGTRFAITLGQRPAGNQSRALQDVDFRARFDLDLSVRRSADPAGPLALVRHPVAVDMTPLRIRGTVGQSLYLSARNAGAPIAAIQSYLQAIDRQVSLESDLAPGDTFDMILAYKRSARGERDVGDLLYAGVERGGKPSVQLVRWGKEGQLMPSPESAPSSAGFAIGAPVAGHITSLFGMRRHPILGYVRMHAGVDFGAPWGSPIYAVADGVVSYAGPHGGHGNYVRLDNGGGIGTGYAHMSRIAVSYGARVRAGQVLGYVGSSGLSTGSHLHFECYRNGQVVNPLTMRFVSRPTVDPAERSAYRARLDALMKVRPGAALGDVGGFADEDGPAGTREIDRLTGD